MSGPAQASETYDAVLADDHEVVRAALRALLERDTDARIVAEAGDGDAALRYVRGHRPDLLLLDLNMPGRDTLEVIRELRESAPDTRIVVLTMEADAPTARAVLQAGAAAYVLKAAPRRILLEAIAAARDGRPYVDPSLGAKIAVLAEQPEGGNPAGLTDREVEVLHHIALGMTNQEIAADLAISVRTVESHRLHVQQKTGLVARSALVRFALDHGLAP